MPILDGLPSSDSPVDLLDYELGKLIADVDPFKRCVSEDWERIHRQQATCVHGRGIQRCPRCRKDLATLLQP